MYATIHKLQLSLPPFIITLLYFKGTFIVKHIIILLYVLIVVVIIGLAKIDMDLPPLYVSSSTGNTGIAIMR